MSVLSSFVVNGRKIAVFCIGSVNSWRTVDFHQISFGIDVNFWHNSRDYLVDNLNLILTNYFHISMEK